MLHTKFRGNQPPPPPPPPPPTVLEKIFEGFLLVRIRTVVSEKIHFEFLYVNDLGPRSKNDLDLQYSHIFICSIRFN